MNCIRCNKQVYSLKHAVCDECRTELARVIVADGKAMGMVDKILARFTTETLKKVLPLAVDDYHARKMLLDQERLEEEGGD